MTNTRRTVLRVSRVHAPITALGPGRRIGVWFQGCSIRCSGCVSLDTWDQDGGLEIEVSELVQLVRSAVASGCTGVTISGGEPFDQTEGLVDLLNACRETAISEEGRVDFLAFSGYGLARLRRRHARALALLDGVVAGPFVLGQPTDLALRGSRNQMLVPLTPLGERRYSAYVERREERPPMQVVVEHGTVEMVGIPRRGDMDRLVAFAAERGVHLDQVSWRP